jgi:type VI secretion system protein ImpJ
MRPPPASACRLLVAADRPRRARDRGSSPIASASGVLPDGTPFDIPGIDAAPAGAEGAGRRARRDRDAGGDAVEAGCGRKRRRRRRNGVDAAALPVRPTSRSADAEAVSLRQAPHPGRALNLRLVLARDANEGVHHAGRGALRELARAARWRWTTATSRRCCMRPVARPVLDGYLRELHGLLHQRGEALASLLSQPGRAGVGEIADFLFLQTINRHEPLFAHAAAAGSVLHPSGCSRCAFSWPANWPPSAKRAARRPTPTTCTTTWPAASGR